MSEIKLVCWPTETHSPRVIFELYNDTAPRTSEKYAGTCSLSVPSDMYTAFAHYAPGRKASHPPVYLFITRTVSYIGQFETL